jgi:glycosyltransferase involved in cell wall biosynthesis
MERVSVVIPAHNAAAFLCEALDSVFAQGLDAPEVVVVDDGSTDGTADLARRYGRGVRVLTQQNAGSGRARNLGLQETSGGWVAFLDADDVWAEDKAALELPLLDADPELAFVFGDLLPFGAAGAGARSLFAERGFDLRCTPSAIFLHDMVYTSTVLLRRACLRETGAFDPSLRIGQDTDLWLRLALARPYAVVPKPLARYRLHGGNTTRNSRLLARCVVEVWERYLDRCIAAEPAMERTLRADLAEKRWHHFFLEGCALLREGRAAESRHFLLRAIREAPLRARAYPFFLASFLRTRARA